MNISLIVELALSGLLLATIGYCAVLERRLSALRKGQDGLKDTIGALNSSIVNLARLIGPSIAGVVIAAYGEGWCFLIDGISYFAVIASLLMMHLRPLHLPERADTEDHAISFPTRLIDLQHRDAG